MNKQELIKKYEQLYKDHSPFNESVCYALMIDSFLKELKQLDKPQKVTVPQFVADYIKDAKYYEWDLDDVFDHIAEESEESEIYKWFYKLGNVDVFARAWLDGYEVEKEKRYIVKMKGVGDISFLNHDLQRDLWFINNGDDGRIFKAHHTRKELEEAGFGWVFDCPGIEVEEVTE